MNFHTKILLITFFVTIVVSIIVIPILKKLKIGQIEREDGPESHLKKQGTPTMGGIIIMISMIIGVVIEYFYFNLQGKSDIVQNILPILGLTIGFGVIGLIDDYIKLVLKDTKGLKPSYKMLGLLIISVVYALFLMRGLEIGTDTYIPVLKTYISMPTWAYVPFAIIVILATTNAVNLTDGIDGLSPSICAIITTCLTIIAMIFGNQEMVLFGSVVVGATLGFLMFNLHPAKIFMGDTGSLLLGGIIAAMALYLKVPLILLVIAFIPVIETVSVMLQVAYFKKTGNRIFKMAPLHHHFELSGWRENRVVIVFSLATLVLCAIGILIV